MTMAEALRDAMRLAMHQDRSVFILGEDVGIQVDLAAVSQSPWGFRKPSDMNVCMDTPISEIAIIGAAVGAALTGMTGRLLRCNTVTSSFALWTR